MGEKHGRSMMTLGGNGWEEMGHPLLMPISLVQRRMPPGFSLHPPPAQMIKELEKKLSMSRSIMRKLYRNNVDPEKECQMLQTNDW